MGKVSQYPPLDFSSRHPNEASTLVVVDDKPEFREMIVSLSEESGLKVVGECSEGRNALSRLRESKPSIAFINIHLLGLSGIEIIRIMHREIPQIRFIVSTGLERSQLGRFWPEPWRQRLTLPAGRR